MKGNIYTIQKYFLYSNIFISGIKSVYYYYYF